MIAPVEDAPTRPYVQHGLYGYSDTFVRTMLGELSMWISNARTAAAQRGLPVTRDTPVEAVIAMLLTAVQR